MPINSNPILPNSVARTDTKEGKISASVAISDQLIDYENRRVVFSFEAYNNNHCRIAKIDKKEAKKLTKELKKISLTLAKHFRYQNTSGIACKPVHNSGNYQALCNAIPEDAELLEVDYSGPGRVFGYMVNNVFNIVTIGKEHL